MGRPGQLEFALSGEPMHDSRSGAGIGGNVGRKSHALALSTRRVAPPRHEPGLPDRRRPRMTLFPRTLNLRQRLALLLLVASVPGMAVAVVLAVNALAVQSQQIEQMATHLAALQAAQHTTVTESARIMLDTLI